MRKKTKFKPIRRKKPAELSKMYDDLGEILSHAPTDSREYHRLYGAYRMLQWVTGVDFLFVGPTVEESLKLGTL
jgi:hypothetical protein